MPLGPPAFGPPEFGPAEFGPPPDCANCPGAPPPLGRVEPSPAAGADACGPEHADRRSSTIAPRTGAVVVMRNVLPDMEDAARSLAADRIGFL